MSLDADRGNLPWPLGEARNVHSQCGEDGIIEALLERIPEPTGWCVEFGAWDGEHLSNSRHFVQNHGYRAVLIEGNTRRSSQLAAAYADNPRVHVVGAMVGLDTDDGLDRILGATEIPQEFDFVSIDIDGNDFHVWRNVRRYRPRIVCIEFNPTIDNCVEYVQEVDPGLKRGASARSLVRLGRELGYELAATTLVNAIFVRREYFDALPINDNSLDNLRRELQHVTHVFVGYDGGLVVTGGQRLPWHEVPMRLRGGSVPRLLRRFPDDYGPVRRLAYYGYRLAREPRATVAKARLKLAGHRATQAPERDGGPDHAPHEPS